MSRKYLHSSQVRAQLNYAKKSDKKWYLPVQNHVVDFHLASFLWIDSAHILFENRDTATLADLVHFEHLLLQYTSCKIQRIQEFHQKVNPAGKNSITQPRALQHFRNKNKFTLSLCLFLSNVGNCRQRISSRLGEKVKQDNFEWVGVSQKWYS